VNPIARLEAWCADVVERSFARAFPGALEPVHVARKVVATVERMPPPEGGARASIYSVRLAPPDFARLEAQRTLLERQWTLAASAVCTRGGLRLHDAPAVVLAQDPGLAAGTIAIDVDHPSPGTPRRPTLRVEHGVEAGKLLRLPLPGRSVVASTVGRDPACDLVVADPRVSRRHLRVTVAPDGYLGFEDLGSSNGTRRNGAPARRGPLHPGDRLQVGDTLLAVEATE
jgi:FHA domain-containing protein